LAKSESGDFILPNSFLILGTTKYFAIPYMDQTKIKEDMFFGATPKIFELAGRLRLQLTPAEEKLWNGISNKKLGVKFRRQHPVNIFIVDFYCHQLKLVIEIDGEVHNETEQRDYDIGRTEELERFGIKVIRFANGEVLNSIENVLRKIQELINESLAHTPGP
jgi:very-short-patch-repair endonuclease